MDSCIVQAVKLLPVPGSEVQHLLQPLQGDLTTFRPCLDLLIESAMPTLS